MNFSRIKNKWHFIFYCIIILICCLEFSFLLVYFKPFNQKYTNFNRNIVKKNKPKNHKQVPLKKYSPKIYDINRDVPNEGTTSSPPIQTFLPPQILSIDTIITNDTNDTNDISSASLIKVEIGSNLSLSLNLIPDISSNDIGLCSQICYNGEVDSCNNRIDYFDSENSTTFEGTYKSETINYLDGSNASALLGYDYITLDKYQFKNKLLLSLFDEINGALEYQSVVEGVMGLGFGSSIWNQLASDGYLQVIGIALPNFICSIGSIAFGGIDLRYIFNDPQDPTVIHNITTLNDTDYPIIEVNTIWVNDTPLDFPVINAIISTNYNKISLGNFSTEFFTKLGANKTNDGNWIVPDPVDISFDVTTDTGPIIGITLSSFVTCNSMIKGQCISIFDDKFGPEFCYQSTTGSCNNRQHIYDSKNSPSFSPNNTNESINYLDGSFANGSFGNDFIILDNFGFANKFSFLLFSQIFGALQAESAVGGVMGLGLTSKGYDQAIGFAFPNYPCPVGSIAFGGIDARFSNNPNETFSVPTLNDNTYPKIEIITIWVNETPLDFPTIDAIISTNYNKISLGNYSTDFFKALGANKTDDGNWVVPNPVDISFDLITDSGLLIGAIIPRDLSCNMIKGQCISIFDDSF
ncbi:13415_t:CDS:2, partial [Gigaspora margarita]